MKKIWFVIGRLGIGGAERTLVDLANGLDHDKYDISICTFSRPNPLSESLNQDVTHLPFGKKKTKFNPWAITRFVYTLHHNKPDVVQSFLPFDNTLARVVYALFPDTKVITGIRSVPNDPNLFVDIIESKMAPMCDLIVSNSKSGKEHLMNRGVDPKIIKVIYNGRDISKYADGVGEPELLDSFGIKESDKIIGTVGRLIERKGHYDLIDAWTGVVKQFPQHHLIFVGDGPERRQLEKRTTKMNCQDSVHFFGERNNIPEILDLMDLFVFPSHFEGLPGALIEAMAAELPIICTPVDGNAELISHGDSGLFVGTNNPQELQKAIIRLLEDQDLAAELARNAKERAEENFNKDIMISSFSSLY